MGEMEDGFLGLGIMGKALSMNLLRHGFKVTVSNRTLSKCDELVGYGASIGEIPTAVIKKCKNMIAMLSGPAAALSEMCAGKGYIDMSTVDADTSSQIGEAITQKGSYFLEASVSGSKKPAEDDQFFLLEKRHYVITYFLHLMSSARSHSI